MSTNDGPNQLTGRPHGQPGADRRAWRPWPESPSSPSSRVWRAPMSALERSTASRFTRRLGFRQASATAEVADAGGPVSGHCRGYGISTRDIAGPTAPGNSGIPALANVAGRGSVRERPCRYGPGHSGATSSPFGVATRITNSVARRARGRAGRARESCYARVTTLGQRTTAGLRGRGHSESTELPGLTPCS